MVSQETLNLYYVAVIFQFRIDLDRKTLGEITNLNVQNEWMKLKKKSNRWDNNRDLFKYDLDVTSHN